MSVNDDYAKGKNGTNRTVYNLIVSCRNVEGLVVVFSRPLASVLRFAQAEPDFFDDVKGFFSKMFGGDADGPSSSPDFV